MGDTPLGGEPCHDSFHTGPAVWGTSDQVGQIGPAVWGTSDLGGHTGPAVQGTADPGDHIGPAVQGTLDRAGTEPGPNVIKHFMSVNFECF